MGRARRCLSCPRFFIPPDRRTDWICHYCKTRRGTRDEHFCLNRAEAARLDRNLRALETRLGRRATPWQLRYGKRIRDAIKRATLNGVDEALRDKKT